MFKTLKHILMYFVVLVIGISIGVSSKEVFINYKDNIISESEDKEIAAIVDGHKIYKEDVIQNLKDKRWIPKTGVKKMYIIGLMNAVAERVVAAEISKLRIKGSGGLYNRRVERLKHKVAHAMFFEEFVKGKVTEEDIKEEYEKIKSQYKDLKEIKVRYIAIKTEAEAKQIIKELDKGKSFSALAKERSFDKKTAKRGGDWGHYMTEDSELAPWFVKKAFLLEKGEYTREPIETNVGWGIFKLEDKRNVKVPKFKDIRRSIRNSLMNDIIDNKLIEFRNKAEVKAFDFNGKEISNFIFIMPVNTLNLIENLNLFDF